MNLEKAESYFLALSGLDIGERENYLPFLQGALEEIEDALFGEIDPKSESRLERLCGAVGFYRLTLANLAREEEDIKIGELTLKSGGKEKSKAAEKLVKEHFKSCEDIFGSKCFSFGRVRIEI